MGYPIENKRVNGVASSALFDMSESDNVLPFHRALRARHLASGIRQLDALRQFEEERLAQDPAYRKMVRMAIVTARNAPAHERMVTTLKSWGVIPDQAFLLGGMEKARILGALRPHIYFDHQIGHLHSEAGNIPMVHIPFGVANRRAA